MPLDMSGRIPSLPLDGMKQASPAVSCYTDGWNNLR